jgi:hypothetical protein
LAKCFKCGADTTLYDNGVPICVRCSEARDKKNESDTQGRDLRIRTALLQDLLETSHLAGAASAGSEMDASEGGAPSTAQRAMGQAHNRLNDYLSHGIVPDDLNRIG